MSKTFEVYPQTAYLPSFEEVLAVAQQKLNEFLEDYGIEARPLIAAQLRAKEPDTVLPFSVRQPAKWDDASYVWFHIPPVGGGTDTYFSYLTVEEREYWNELCADNEQVIKRREFVQNCLSQGYYWSFRRSMGQSGLISLTYGLIAASFAELTDGFIYSDDSAWDYARFPATAQEFSAWYFRPEQALGVDNKGWAERCLASIAQEFQSASF